MEDKKKVTEAWIRALIEDFIAHDPRNTLKNRPEDKAFENPLVGFSRGDDPIFDLYKDAVGPFHLRPIELFEDAFPGTDARPEELAVISWVLPHIKQTKKDNRMEVTYPSERWARGRIYGEEVNDHLRRHVSDSLNQAGFQALVPVFSKLWEVKTSGRFGLASTWSERHAAYAAGLGTFGLCDGLITLRGKAMRTGSVIARIPVSPAARPYTEHRAYCLFFSEGACRRCMERCPVGAITEEGKDKEKCRAHLKPGTEDYVKTNYGFDGYGCGLCQTGVPCESGIPDQGVR